MVTNHKGVLLGVTDTEPGVRSTIGQRGANSRKVGRLHGYMSYMEYMSYKGDLDGLSDTIVRL